MGVRHRAPCPWLHSEDMRLGAAAALLSPGGVCPRREPARGTRHRDTDTEDGVLLTRLEPLKPAAPKLNLLALRLLQRQSPVCSHQLRVALKVLTDTQSVQRARFTAKGVFDKRVARTEVALPVLSSRGSRRLPSRVPVTRTENGALRPVPAWTVRFKSSICF